MMPAVSVNASGAPSNLQHIQAMMSDAYFYPSVDGANVAPLVDVALLDGTGLACVPLAANSLNGKFALIQVTASCPVNTDSNGVYDQQALNAQNAGAIGFVWYQSNSTSIYSAPYAEGIYEYGPGVVISNSDGLNLKAYIDAHPGATVTIDTAGAEIDLSSYSNDFAFSPSAGANLLASYSSFGPTPDGRIKPDLVATGGDDPDLSPDPNDYYLPSATGMYMAGETFDPNGILYTANGFAAADGTSFAAPLTAGAAALMKQAHPSLNGQQIKSLLVNNASALVGRRGRLLRTAGGRRVDRRRPPECRGGDHGKRDGGSVFGFLWHRQLGAIAGCDRIDQYRLRFGDLSCQRKLLHGQYAHRWWSCNTRHPAGNHQAHGNAIERHAGRRRHVDSYRDPLGDAARGG